MELLLHPFGEKIYTQLHFSPFIDWDFDPNSIWIPLASNSSNQINISHLTSALTNYVTFEDLEELIPSPSVNINVINDWGLAVTSEDVLGATLGYYLKEEQIRIEDKIDNLFYFTNNTTTSRYPLNINGNLNVFNNIHAEGGVSAGGIADLFENFTSGYNSIIEVGIGNGVAFIESDVSSIKVHKANFLTEHQSLSDYYNSSEIDVLLSNKVSFESLNQAILDVTDPLYLKLSGGNLTGPLSGTTASFTGNIHSDSNISANGGVSAGGISDLGYDSPIIDLYTDWSDNAPTNKALGAALGVELHNTKVDKVAGYALSKNDLSDALLSDLNANTSARHSHSNEAVLDNITITDVNNWNSAYSWGDHASAGYLLASFAEDTYIPYVGANKDVDLGNKSISLYNLYALNNIHAEGGVAAGGISDLSEGVSIIDLYRSWDDNSPVNKALSAELGIELNNTLTNLVSISHSHSNKAILDGTTASFILEEKTKLAGIEDNANNYILPYATTAILGGVIIGSNIDVSSGIISVKDASTLNKGIVKLSDSVSSTSSSLSATSKAVKTAWDLANSKWAWNENEIKVVVVNRSLTADKLTAPISLWGQLFDGSSDVNGDLHSTGNISADGGISAGGIGDLSEAITSGYNDILPYPNDTGNAVTSLTSNGGSTLYYRREKSFSEVGHNHDTAYSLLGHVHDDRYYTEVEISNIFSGLAPVTGYNKSNWDLAFSWGNHQDAGYALDSDLTTHTGNSTIHITATERTNWNAAASTLSTHIDNVSNPHSVTKEQVGLGNVEDTKLSTWAGTTNITTLGTISGGTWHGSVVEVLYGGTGKSSIAINKMLYASSANVFSEISTTSFGRGLLNTESDTMIVGLNADLLDGLHGVGFVNVASTQEITGSKTFTKTLNILESLNVSSNIHAGGNISADGGVSAGGLSDLSEYGSSGFNDIEYIGSGNIVTNVDKNVSSLKVFKSFSVYSDTEIDTIISTEISNRNTAITDAINQLDVVSVGGSGKYISAISEANGKISATESDMPTLLSQFTDNLGSSPIHTHSQYMLASASGAVNGVAPLDINRKIPAAYLYDYFFGQVLYGGGLGANALATLTSLGKSKLGTTSSTITLTNNNTAITGYVANEGIYYIVTSAQTFAGIAFEVGDWCISNGSAWTKVDNTDAVASVAGLTGAISKASLLSALNVANGAQVNIIESVKLNDTAITPTSKIVNVNACTSITVPIGLSVAALDSNGLITISLATGYAIPMTASITQIETNISNHDACIGALAGQVLSLQAKNQFDELYSEYAHIKTLSSDLLIGYLKGNADTATKLATARTLWGQSFDGSAEIKDKMLQYCTGLGYSTTRQIELSSGLVKVNGTLNAASASFSGNVTDAAIHYFANGTTYYVNASGAAKFNGTNTGALTATTGEFTGKVHTTNQVVGDAGVFSGGIGDLAESGSSGYNQILLQGTGNAVTSLSTNGGSTLFYNRDKTFSEAGHNHNDLYSLLSHNHDLIYQPLNSNLTTIVGLTGTGFLKKTSTSWLLDNATYLTSNQTITLSGIITGSGTTSITTSIADEALSIAKTLGLQSALDAKMATSAYPDLVAIEALSGTSGFLKKTAANTWSLDTNTYLTGITKAQVEAVLTGAITSHTHNYQAPLTGTGFVKSAAGVISYDTNTYLTTHQTIYGLTIQKNGDTIATYTPNSASKTINISDVASATSLDTLTTNTDQCIGALAGQIISLQLKNQFDELYAEYAHTRTLSSDLLIGALKGNADTATAFQSAQSIALTGDISGSASSTGGWSIATTIGAGRVTNAMLVKSSVTISGKSVSLGGSISQGDLRSGLGLQVRTATMNSATYQFLTYDGYGTTSFAVYAPTAAGTSGQLLKSTGGTPTWVSQGSGGGIDADKLDDMHAIDFVNVASEQTITGRKTFSNDIVLTKNLVIANAQAFYGKNTTGDTFQLLGTNSNNDTTLGYGARVWGYKTVLQGYVMQAVVGSGVSAFDISALGDMSMYKSVSIVDNLNVGGIIQGVGGVFAGGIADLQEDSWNTPTLTSGTQGTTWGSVRYRKVGTNLQIDGSFTFTWNGSSQYTIFTLPTGYRPTRDLTGVCYCINSGMWRYWIQTDGDVVLINSVSFSGANVTTSQTYVFDKFNLPLN